MSEGVQHIIFAVGRMDANGVTLLGSAFALNKSGFFATCSHVVGMDDSGLVLVSKQLKSLSDYQDTSDNQVKLFHVKISAVNPLYDTAVLQSTVEGFQSVNIAISGADAAPVGAPVSSYGFPHADHSRMVLTQQEAEVGARVLILSGGIKAKHLILNTQTRPGQSGSPVFLKGSNAVVGIVVGSYAPGGGGGISLGGVDPHTLHQTTHVVSAEYLLGMY